MTPAVNWIAESTFQDAMRIGGGKEKAVIISLYDGRNDEPRVFLVVTPELLDNWKELVDKS